MRNAEMSAIVTIPLGFPVRRIRLGWHFLTRLKSNRQIRTSGGALEAVFVVICFSQLRNSYRLNHLIFRFIVIKTMRLFENVFDYLT